jgi:exodeoxyribonuclease X
MGEHMDIITEALILDTETASLQGGIVEWAWLLVDAKTLDVKEEFRTLVNPGRPIDPRAQAIHGITEDMVKDCQPISAYMGRFRIKRPYVIAHNAPFDLRMLEGELDPMAALCTYALARVNIKGTTNHRLETLKNELGFPPQQSHSALGDVYTVRDLLLHLLPLMGVDLQTLFERVIKPKMILRMPHGIHKGKLIVSLPKQYKELLLREHTLDKDLRYSLEQAVKV